MRRNSVYVAFILGGAMVGERVSISFGFYDFGRKEKKRATKKLDLLFLLSSLSLFFFRDHHHSKLASPSFTFSNF